MQPPWPTDDSVPRRQSHLITYDQPLRSERRDEPLFADDAVARLHRVSSGLPRMLNNAAIAALIAGAADGKDLVDDASPRAVPQFDPPSAGPHPTDA